MVSTFGSQEDGENKVWLHLKTGKKVEKNKRQFFPTLKILPQFSLMCKQPDFFLKKAKQNPVSSVHTRQNWKRVMIMTFNGLFEGLAYGFWATHISLSLLSTCYVHGLRRQLSKTTILSINDFKSMNKNIKQVSKTTAEEIKKSSTMKVWIGNKSLHSSEKWK